MAAAHTQLVHIRAIIVYCVRNLYFTIPLPPSLKPPPWQSARSSLRPYYLLAASISDRITCRAGRLGGGIHAT